LIVKQPVDCGINPNKEEDRMSNKEDGKTKGMNRRDFMKKSAVAAGAAAISVTGWPVFTSPAWAG